MLIDDIATRPAVTCRPDATVSDVAKLMADANVGCVVVVDDEGGAVGVCTDRDLVIRVLAGAWSVQTPVHCAMTESVLTLPTGTDATEAIQRMGSLGHRRVPMVDDNGRVVGVVSLDDLTGMLARELDDVARIARTGRRRARS